MSWSCGVGAWGDTGRGGDVLILPVPPRPQAWRRRWAAQASEALAKGLLGLVKCDELWECSAGGGCGGCGGVGDLRGHSLEWDFLGLWVWMAVSLCPHCCATIPWSSPYTPARGWYWLDMGDHGPQNPPDPPPTLTRDWSCLERDSPGGLEQGWGDPGTRIWGAGRPQNMGLGSWEPLTCGFRIWGT